MRNTHRQLLVILSGLLSQPVLAQQLGQGTTLDLPLWRVAGALVLCLALAIGGGFALRYRMRSSPTLFGSRPRRLELVEVLRLGHQVDLCLVRCDDQEMVVAASSHGVRFGPVIGRPAASADEI